MRTAGEHVSQTQLMAAAAAAVSDELNRRRIPHFGAMSVVRELHELGATRVKVGDIEADFPARIVELPTEREKPVERTPAEWEAEHRRIALAGTDADTDEQES